MPCLPSLTPFRTIAEQALEVVGLADRGLYLGGGDDCCVLSGSADGRSWPDTQPARDRGSHPHLQSALVHHVSCSVPCSSLLIICAAAPGRRGRAPAAQVACLRCR